MKYKMLCLDIDGTLLDSNHKITGETKKTINVATNKGINVVLVSARMPKGILYLQKELGIEEPIICYSGSLIRDRDGNTLLNKFIPAHTTKLVYDATEKMGIHISLYKNDEWYIAGEDAWSKQESEITGIIPKITNLKGLVDKWEKSNDGPNKILCMSQIDNINILNKDISSRLSNDINIYPSKPTYLEIMPKYSSKTKAIECVSQKLNILKSEIIAIGDNYNDMDMIQYAAVGIAMGNAPDKVKLSADYVTLTNDENGVAVAIKKYIGIKVES